MSEQDALTTINKVFQAIFQRDNPYDLETLKQKFAFDIKLPTEVKDSSTDEITYTAMPNVKQFMTCANVERYDKEQGWMLPKQEVKSLNELLKIWHRINYTTTERVYNSERVSKSDPIYNSADVYASTNCGGCEHIAFCDGCWDSSYLVASQRSTGLNFCLRVDDSNTCTNSYNVICSNKVSQSLFIQDASNLFECIFCSHLANKKFCIANMQFSESEYFFFKSKIIEWFFSSED